MTRVGRNKPIPRPKDPPPVDVSTLSGDALKRMFLVAAAGTKLDDRLAGVLALIKRSEFEVIDDDAAGAATLDADAAVDPHSGKVLIPEELAEKIRELKFDLLKFKKGSRKKRGGDAYAAARRGEVRIKNKDSKKFHELAARLALIVHEAVHVQQAKSGALANLPSQLKAAYDAGGDNALLREYVRRVELPAQIMQERAQFALGEPPEDSSWQTITDSGELLSEDEIIDRMIAARGDSMLESARAELAGEGHTHDPEGRIWKGEGAEGRIWKGNTVEGRIWKGDTVEGRIWKGELS